MNGIRGLLMGLGIAVLSACSQRQVESLPPQAAVPGVPAGPVAPAAPTASPSPPVAVIEAPPSRAWTLETYKLEVARWITRSSAEHLFEGAPPPMLKSIVVLTIAVDRDGQPRSVVVRRSNGFKALEQRAVQSVRNSAPLPRPGLIVSRGGVAEFTETWLFRDDGRFQLRSLALAQREGEG